MQGGKDLFTTYGTLRATVIEAVDLADQSSSSKKGSVWSQGSIKPIVYVVLKVEDADGIELKQHNTAAQPLFGTLVIQEEFLFESISSANYLRLYFYDVSVEKTDTGSEKRSTEKRCLGMCEVPLSRLEDNKPFMQWHQLVNQAYPDEGLRSAVKMECTFTSDGKSTDTKSIMGQSKRSSDHSFSSSARGNRFFDEEDAHVDEESEESSESEDWDATYEDLGVDERPRRDREFVRCRSGKSSEGSATGSSRRAGNTESGKVEDEEEGESKGEDRAGTRLEAGLIDYCVMLGPAAPFDLLEPTHQITPSGIRNLSFKTAGMDVQSPGGAHTGLFGVGRAEGLGPETQEVVIWDRLPRADLMDLDMPSKLEWFACPEGSKTVLQSDRPEPHFQSFVLSSGGETEEIHGLSLNFFIELAGFGALDDRQKEALTPYSPSPGNSLHTSTMLEAEAWWRRGEIGATGNASLGTGESKRHGGVGAEGEGGDSDSGSFGFAERSQPRLWTLVSLCLLYRSGQHVQQLRKCLDCAYSAALLPSLRSWEVNWADQVALQMGVLGDPPGEGEPLRSLLSRDNISSILASSFHTSFAPFSLSVEKLVATLCLECPLPVPGFLDVLLELPGGEALQRCVHSSTSRWRGSYLDPAEQRALENAGAEAEGGVVVGFTATSPEDFPACPYPLEVLLRCLGPRVLIDVVCCVLSECRMLFHSCDLSLLPVICEGLRALIYPLQWTHVYLPVVPMHLLNVVEAPVPFMLGTHSSWLRFIQGEYMQDMVLVDCDTGALSMNGALAMELPIREDRWLMHSLRAILHGPLPCHDQRNTFNVYTLGLDPEASEPDAPEALVDVNTQVQLAFYDVLFQLLRYVPDCLFYLNPKCPVFNRPLFISDYATDEYRATLELLTVTNCFHVLTESIHTPSLAFFYKNILRLAEAEKARLEDVGESRPSSPQQTSANTSTSGKITRNVSMSSVLHDKMVKGHVRSLSASMSDLNMSDVTAAVVRDDEREVGKGRRISVVGLGNDFKSYLQQRSSAGSMFTMNGENPNEAAYESLLPTWLVAPSHLRGSATARVDNIKALLDSRIRHYLPYLRHAAKTAPSPYPSTPDPTLATSRTRGVYHIKIRTAYALSAFASAEPNLPQPPQSRMSFGPELDQSTGQDTKESSDDSKSDCAVHSASSSFMFKTSGAGKFGSVSSAFEGSPGRGEEGEGEGEGEGGGDFDSEPDMPGAQERDQRGVDGHDGEDAQEGTSLDQENGSSWNMKRQDDVGMGAVGGGLDSELDGSDEETDSFNRDDMMRRQQSVRPTEVDLCYADHSHPLAVFDTDKLKLAQAQVTRWSVAHLAQELGTPMEPLLATYLKVRSTASSRLCANTQFAARNRAVSTASRQNRRYMTDQATVDQLAEGGGCAECITQLLQKVVTESVLDAKWLDSAIELSLTALEEAHNRTALIAMLKNAKQSKEKRDASNVFPLNPTAFDAFSRLFAGTLRICSELEDYLTAYGLLEVGGLYFCFLLHDDEIETPDDIMEFLSQRTCQHPIYHNSDLWRALMCSRVPPPDAKLGKIARAHVLLHSVLSEVYALLFIMLELEVNNARALLFIQGVASDYALSINEYTKLQRFVNRIWTINVDELAAEQERVKRESTPRGRKHKGRTSLSLGDMLSMQGHDSSKLFSSKNEEKGKRHSKRNDEEGAKVRLNRTGGSSADSSPSSDASNARSPDLPHLLSRKGSMRDSFYGEKLEQIDEESEHSSDSDRVSRASRVSRPNHSEGLLQCVFLGLDKPIPSLDEMDSFDLRRIPSIDESYRHSVTEDDLRTMSGDTDGGPLAPTPRHTHRPKTVSMDLPRKFSPLPLIGLDEGQVTATEVSGNWLVSGTHAGCISITDLATGVVAATHRHSSGSGDAYRGVTSLVCLQDVATTTTSSATNSPTSAGDKDPGANSPAQLFFSGCSNGVLRAWTLPQDGFATSTPQPASTISKLWGRMGNNQSLATIKGHSAEIGAMAVRREGEGWLLAAGDSAGLVSLTRGSDNSSHTISLTHAINPTFAHNGSSQKIYLDAPPPDLSICCLAFIGAERTAESPLSGKRPPTRTLKPRSNDEYLGVGTSTGLVSLLDLTTAQPVFQVVAHSGRVTQLLGLRANEFISSSTDRSIKLWDIRTRNRSTQTLDGRVLEGRSMGSDGHKKCAASAVTAIAVGGGDDSLVISTSADGVVRIWDRRYDVNTPSSVSQGHRSRITAIAWNGVDEFHTASHDGTVRTWDSINGQNTYLLRAFDDEGVAQMKMTSFRRANNVIHTPHGPVEFTDLDNPGTRTCIVTNGWNGTLRCFVYDQHSLSC